MLRFTCARSRRARHAAALALLAALALSAHPARSQPATDEAATPGAAEQLDRSAELFREGRVLLRAGRNAEACTKFEQSFELRRSPGTLLNIGSCREAKPDLAGAVRAFRGALELARTETDPAKAALWSDAARQNLERLEPRVSELRLSLVDATGVQLSLDGTPLASSTEPIVLEPGSYQLRASAPGMQDFSVGVELVAGAKLALSIPPLSPAQGSASPEQATAQPLAPPAANAPAVAAAPAWHWWLLGGAGALFVAGSVVGLVAADQAGELKRRCPDRNCPDGLGPVRRVRRTALIADGSFAASALTAGIGLALVLSEPDAATPTALGAGCTSNGCAVELSGRF